MNVKLQDAGFLQPLQVQVWVMWKVHSFNLHYIHGQATKIGQCCCAIAHNWRTLHLILILHVIGIEWTFDGAYPFFLKFLI